ncbi:MAG: endolytic transglycosylase MltG [bacterium]|nr:endolytic transglycosylase MltG [bacterium]
MILILIISILIYTVYPYEEIYFDIEYGESFNSVAKRLKEEGIIASEIIFKRLAIILGVDKKVIAGRYKLSKKFGTIDALSKFSKGEISGIKLRIPEGASLEDIAELLDSNSVAKKALFINYVKANKLNGYLYPDTYFFSKNMPVEYVVSTMYENFKKKIPEYTSKDFFKKLILASIIEKEASDPVEKRIIAGIFYNRLKKGIKLESCATVRYAVKKETAPLTIKDLRFKSPFNTYVNYGLPPEPICNPSSSSIYAAMYPISSNLLYFQVKERGKHSFFVNFIEHVEYKKMKKRYKL